MSNLLQDKLPISKAVRSSFLRTGLPPSTPTHPPTHPHTHTHTHTHTPGILKARAQNTLGINNLQVSLYDVLFEIWFMLVSYYKAVWLVFQHFGIWILAIVLVKEKNVVSNFKAVHSFSNFTISLIFSKLHPHNYIHLVHYWINWRFQKKFPGLHPDLLQLQRIVLVQFLGAGNLMYVIGSNVPPWL